MIKPLSVLTVALLGAALPVQASTVTLTFQQGVNGYTGTQDTMVRSNETGTGSGQTSAGDSRNLSFGNVDFVSVDGDDGSPGNKPNHGLIRFDNMFGSGSGQIRATDTILSAKLRLVIFDAGSGMLVYDMLSPWSESSTWNSLVDGVQTDGVEAAATPIASFGANNGNANVPTGDLVIDVTTSLQKTQAGLLPGHGWALIPYANGTNGIDFYSSEYAIAGLRPLLTVEVMPVPEPETWAMLLAGLGLVGWVARRRSAHTIRA